MLLDSQNHHGSDFELPSYFCCADEKDSISFLINFVHNYNFNYCQVFSLLIIFLLIILLPILMLVVLFMRKTPK